MCAKKFLSLLKNSFIILIFLIIVIIGYFSISESENIPIVNKIVKTVVEKNIAKVKIENLKTGIFLDLKDGSLILSLKDFEIAYAQKTFITLPHLKLKLSPINLILWRSGQIIKGIIFDDQKMHIAYKKKFKTKNMEMEKFPISNFIAIANKYKKHLVNAHYKSHNFSFNIQTAGKEHTIVLKDFELQFDDLKNGINANVKAGININDLELQSEFTIRNNAQKSLDIKGIILSAIPLQNAQSFKITDTDFKMGFQLDINTRIHFLNFFEQVNFQFLQKDTAYIDNSAYFNDNMRVNNLEFKGVCLDNFKQINVAEIKAKVEDKILIDGIARYTPENLTSNFKITNLSTEQFLKKWSDNLCTKVRHWLLKHLLAGEVVNFQITKNRSVQKSSSNTSITLQNANLKYLNTAPNLYLKEAQLKFSSSSLSINSSDAKISNTRIKDITAKIDDLSENEITMKFNANIEGAIADQIKIANAHYKIPDLPHIKGIADTKLSFAVPFYKIPTFQDINLDLQSQLQGVGIQNFMKGYSLSNGNFEAKLSGHRLHARGQGKINDYLNTQIDSVFSIQNKHDFTIYLNSTDSLSHFQKAGIPFSEFFSDTIKVNGTVKGGKTAIESEFSADLYNTSVDLEVIGASKKPKVPGKIFIKFDNNWIDETKISKITFTIPNQVFDGEGIINNKIGKLIHLKGNVSQRNLKDLTFQYNKIESLEKIKLNGKEADISQFNMQKLFALLSKEGAHKKSPFSFSSKIGMVRLKNDVPLERTNIQVSNDLGNKRFNVSGILNDDKVFRAYYNYPVLSITSSDAGAVLAGLGITQKVNTGSLEIKGQFQTPQKFEGHLELNDFYVLKTPALLNLLTLSAPLSTLQSSIENKGIKFHTFKCPVRYENNKLVFTNCVAKSKLLALKISGSIDLSTGYLNSKGIIIPKNILNTLSKKIFFLNILSGYKNEGLILSTLFDMKGYIDQDMKIQANYLSTFTPGFLREIFKKPIDVTPNTIVN